MGPAATVPADVAFDEAERAFVFPGGGGVITVPLSTNPDAYADASYEIWLKMLSETESTRGWIMSQSPDWGWARAITMTDSRLGSGASISVACGAPPVQQQGDLSTCRSAFGASTVTAHVTKWSSVRLLALRMLCRCCRSCTCLRRVPSGTPRWQGRL